MYISSLRPLAILLLIFIFSFAATAQTPGLIVRPTPPATTSIVLDPDRNGFTSLTTAGFTGTSDVGAANSEIPYKVVPPFKLEPNADLMRGPNDRFTDLVRLTADESGMYVYLDDKNNMLFRLRLGDIVSGSKGYSILIDADGKFGNTGVNADPNYQAATNGSNGNPGFELEVVLETNFRVAVYNVDGTSNPTLVAAYGTSSDATELNNHSLISFALSNVSDNPDFFYDFYVPLSDLKWGASNTPVTASTPIRISGTTVMAPQAAIGGPKSDIYGYDGNDYMKAWETIINAQPAFKPSDVTISGTGIGDLLCTAAPTLNTPITVGATSFSGTWTRADATRPTTATITLYKGAIAIGTTNATSGVAWKIDVPASSAAAAADVFYVKAQAATESACLESNRVTVLGCTALPAAPTITCGSEKGLTGTIPLGSTLTIYPVSSTRPDVATGTAVNQGLVYTTNTTNITFNLYGPNSQTNNACQGQNNFFTQGTYMLVTNNGSCSSAPLFICITGNNQNSWSVPAVSTTLTISKPVYAGQGSITVNGTASGNLIRIYNTTTGRFLGSATATGTSVVVPVTSFATGDQLVAYSQTSTATACMTVSAAEKVSCVVNTPIINTTGNQILAGGAITGTSNEPVGTAINIYDASAPSVIAANTTVQTGGTWSTGSFVAASGKSYFAVATKTCGSSIQSATVAAIGANATVRCSTIPSVAESDKAITITSTLSGTAVAGTKVRLLANGIAIDSVITATNSYSITVNEGYTDYIAAGDVLTIEVQESGRLTEVCAASIKVSCSPPATPTVTYTTRVVSNENGSTAITVNNSVLGILYTLEDATGADRSISVFGTGGAITLSSYPNLLPGVFTYRVSAFKLGAATGCSNAYSGSITITAPDNDNDGIIDPVDIDDDNDGIIDTNEQSATGNATADADNDGMPNYKDADFCTLNSKGVCSELDKDGDGIINQFDLDTDNDGIPDLVENGGTDTDNDGKIDNTTDANKDGLRDAAGATGLTLLDFDGDGLPNFRDMDADGDGVLDSREGGLGYNDATGLNFDTNSNGLLSDDAGYADTNKDGWSDAVDAIAGALALRNTDGRGKPDYLDIDNDDDGIVDNIEAQSTSGYKAPTTSDLDRDGISDPYDNNTSAFGGTANNGIIPNNADGDSQPDYRDTDSDNDGFPDAAEGHDTNGDNLPNANTATKNGVGGTTDVDDDGLLDGYDNDITKVNPANSTTPQSYPNIDVPGTAERDWREANDADGDGIIDTADLDDDNDGIPDVVEGGGYNPAGDEDNDGLLNYLDPSPGAGPAFVDANGDGISDAYDRDRDGIINSLDLDSDNDGIADIAEAGGVDTNGDGRVDYAGTFASNDVDGDGLINIYDTPANALGSLDSDGDTIPNIFDLDSDNDGIPDVVEMGGVDQNGDGRLDNYRDSDGDGLDSRVDGDADNNGTAENSAGALLLTGPDANGDGKADSYPQGAANTDGRMLPNFLDLDSDDDGLPDLLEAGGADNDNNGKVDVFADTDNDGFADARDGDVGNDGIAENIANVLIPTGADANSDGRADAYPKANADGAAFANPYDLDSDNDGIPDLIEQGGVDDNGDGMVDDPADTNKNGWPDAYDPTVAGGINLKTLDANGVTAGGLVFDFDGDGIANYLDLDSDNDGIPDVVEQGGVDADNDGKLDAITDVDKDGFIDLADPVNNSNISALGTPLITTGAVRNGNKLPLAYSAGDNLDAQGLINMLDLDADGDGILDAREAGLPDADNNGIADGILGNDGWSDDVDALTTLNMPNTDSKGNPNFLDIDSDDDGITDNVEGQTSIGYQPPSGTDTEGDGIDDQYDNDDAAYGGGTNNGITPNNHDGDNLPDYLDTDTDGDGDTDLVEGNDLNGNARPDDVTGLSTTADADGDGLIDFFDGDPAAPIVTIAGFGNGTGSKSTAQRTINTFADRDWRNKDFSLTSFALPVRFVSLAVSVQANGNHVKWTVTEEVNVLNYEVERSPDGSRFEKVGTVPHRAATATTNTYQYLDAGARYPVAYYRIRQVDVDGKATYSSTVRVSAANVAGGAPLRLFPVPASASSVVVIEARTSQTVRLWVADAEGRIVGRHTALVQKGSNTLPAGFISHLPAGSYVLLAAVDGQNQQVKFVK